MHMFNMFHMPPCLEKICSMFWDWIIQVIVNFGWVSKNWPLGRFFHRVAMSMYMFVPFSCNFSRGLSLALRSNDLIPPPLNISYIFWGGVISFFKINHATSPKLYWSTIHISWEILCLRYARFLAEDEQKPKLVSAPHQIPYYLMKCVWQGGRALFWKHFLPCYKCIQSMWQTRRQMHNCDCRWLETILQYSSHNNLFHKPRT